MLSWASQLASLSQLKICEVASFVACWQDIFVLIISKWWFCGNDVPIFGDGSLSGADELWSSSKDVSNSPSKPLPSIWASQDLGLDIRTEFEQQENQPFPFTGKANGPSSQSVPSVHVTPGIMSIRVKPHLNYHTWLLVVFVIIQIHIPLCL